MTKMLLHLVSSIHFIFSFRFHRMMLMKKKNILWWFGGNWSINSQDWVIFMPDFGRFWSVGIMTQRPSFFNYFFVSILTATSRKKPFFILSMDGNVTYSIHCYLHNNGPSTTQLVFKQGQIISRGKRNLFMTYHTKIP